MLTFLFSESNTTERYQSPAGCRKDPHWLWERLHHGRGDEVQWLQRGGLWKCSQGAYLSRASLQVIIATLNSFQLVVFYFPFTGCWKIQTTGQELPRGGRGHYLFQIQHTQCTQKEIMRTHKSTEGEVRIQLWSGSWELHCLLVFCISLLSCEEVAAWLVRGFHSTCLRRLDQNLLRWLYGNTFIQTCQTFLSLWANFQMAPTTLNFVWTLYICAPGVLDC